MTNSVAVGSSLSFLRPRALRRNRSGSETAVASDLQHIFVIAGPSGSGKSTFMREFVEGRLPNNISDDLPRQAKTWARTCDNELSRKGLPRILRAKGSCPGLVLHYDIMRAHTRGFEHYANDPAMLAVTTAKAALTVLTILPSREALFEQFLTRARNNDHEEWWDRKRLLRPLKSKLRGAYYRLVGKSPRLMKEGYLVLLGVYGSEGRLRQWTSRWENFLDGVRRGRNDVHLVYVTPESSPDDYPRFRLLRRA